MNKKHSRPTWDYIKLALVKELFWYLDDEFGEDRGPPAKWPATIDLEEALGLQECFQLDHDISFELKLVEKLNMRPTSKLKVRRWEYRVVKAAIEMERAEYGPNGSPFKSDIPPQPI